MITMMERYRIEHQTPPFVPNFKSLCKNKQNNIMHITNDNFRVGAQCCLYII